MNLLLGGQFDRGKKLIDLIEAQSAVVEDPGVGRNEAFAEGAGPIAPWQDDLDMRKSPS